jgi:polysaccharide export outer membrane protein
VSLVGLLGHGAHAQAPAAATTPAAPAGVAPALLDLVGVSNDYQVGPGDLLEIQVVTQSDLTQTLRVSSSGEISYPTLGMIAVGGLTVFEIETAIAARLREKGFLKEPDVLVSVREYQAKVIYVSGSVLNPGQFIMSQDLTVAHAILLAGGLQYNAADDALLHRRAPAPANGSPGTTQSGEPQTGEPLRIDLRPLKEGRFYELSMPMKNGDVLVIPDVTQHAYYVVGEVYEPRNYFYQPGQTVTASQAISVAGGPMPTAKLSNGMLVRFDSAGRRTETKVDFSGILRGNQDDFVIQENDVLFIPGSKVKTITSGLLSMTDQMVMSTAFRIGRTYQLPGADEAATQNQLLRQSIQPPAR